MFKKTAVLIAIILMGLAFLLFYRGHTSGAGLLDHIPIENITEITVQKTIDDGTTIEDRGTFELDQAEIDRFYEIFSETQIKDIGGQPFSFDTDIRYFVFFHDPEGRTNGTMKFYENEAVIFDYVYGDRPALHKRYRILSSSLNEFFRSICHEG